MQCTACSQVATQQCWLCLKPRCNDHIFFVQLYLGPQLREHTLCVDCREEVAGMVAKQGGDVLPVNQSLPDERPVYGPPVRSYTQTGRIKQKKRH